LLYANIFVGNKNIEDLEELFDAKDSDILLLVEFSDVHFD
jgi:hypothetical protein